MNAVKKICLLSCLVLASSVQTNHCASYEEKGVVACLLNMFGFDQEQTAQNQKQIIHVENGIVDYDAARDILAVKAMFSESWMWLGMNNAQDVSFIDGFLHGQGTYSKVLRIDGKTVGFIKYVDYVDYGYIAFLVVNANYRKCGYAHQLLKFAIDDLLGRGMNEIRLYAHKDNDVALAFYENKFGFKVELPTYLDLVLNVA